MWIDSRFDLMKAIRQRVKSVRADLPVGWHIWHNVSFSPFHRAEMDYGEIAGFSDFVKPVLYANAAGERLKSFAVIVGGNVLGDLGATLDRIEITDLRDNTYYAVIHLLVQGGARAIDSRPSDAISLALRTKSPIYVARRVLEASSVLQQSESATPDANLSNVSPDKWAEILERMSPEDFKYKM